MLNQLRGPLRLLAAAFAAASLGACADSMQLACSPGQAFTSAAPGEVDLAPGEFVVLVGLRPPANPCSATVAPLRWTSSDPAVAQVEALDSRSARITAVAPGTATISSTDASRVRGRDIVVLKVGR